MELTSLQINLKYINFLENETVNAYWIENINYFYEAY